MKKALMFTALLTGIAMSDSLAQCSMIALPLNERVTKSELVVEGKVLSQRSYWNEEHSLILTSHTIEVYKVFKGSVSSNQVEVVTEGGTVGDEGLTVIPSPQIIEGSIGVFQLQRQHQKWEQRSNEKNASYVFTENAQGVISYELKSASASDPFFQYKNIESDLYRQLTMISGQKVQIIKENAFTLGQAVESQNRVSAVPIISSFFPTSISAGNFEKLTITGSGFGTTQGTVSFKNADNGGSTFIQADPKYITLWTDTKIELSVPALEVPPSSRFAAGTGNIKVGNASGTATSTQVLTVKYAILDFYVNPNILPFELTAPSSAGTFMWTYNTSFKNNTAAVNSFAEAMKSYNFYANSPGVNWVMNSSTSSITTGISDGVNIITFDNSTNPIGVNELARTYLWRTACTSNGEKSAYITGVDIIINDTPPSPFTWYLGSSTVPSNQVDFQTNALHELGHALTLGHVIDVNDPMHFTMSNGISRRLLSCNDLEGGRVAVTNSISSKGCSGYFPLKTRNLDIIPKNVSVGHSCQFTLTASSPNLSSGTTLAWYSKPWNRPGVNWTWVGNGNPSILLYGTGENTWYRVQDAVNSGRGCGFANGESDPVLVTYNGQVCNTDPSVEKIITVGSGDVDMKLNITPNPAKERLNLNVENMDSPNSKVTIIDLMGKIVYSSAINPDSNGGLVQDIDVSTFVKGLYLIKVETTTKVKTQKVWLE